VTRARRRGRGDAEAVEGVVTRMGAAGDGLVRLADGRDVWVRGVAIGERVAIDAIVGKRPLRGELRVVIDPSPQRVAIACPHVAACGGCDWMHLGPDHRMDLHDAAVRAALERAGVGPLPSVTRRHRPSAALAYRARARLQLAAAAGTVRVGYRSPRSHALVDVASCAVLRPELAPVVDELREWLGGSSGSGECQIGLGGGGRPVLDLRWQGELAPEVFGRAAVAVESGAWQGARVWLDGATQPALFGDPRPGMLAADGLPLVASAGGFGQPSPEGARLLAERAAALLGTTPGPTVELFAGSGTLSVEIARHARPFVAVEQRPEAADALRLNLASRDLTARVVVADANGFRIPRSTSAVVLDPPRIGAPGVMQTLSGLRLAQVIYVSCNPSTLARDLAQLAAAGYRMTDLELVDLFPQTSHVEVLARLAPA
jgi:23S rRNA (uracil1939-C5)-methyltransferase